MILVGSTDTISDELRPYGHVGYAFDAPTRYDRLFSGLATPRPEFVPEGTTRWASLTPEETLDADIKANGLLVVDGQAATLTVEKTTTDANGTSTSTTTQSFKLDGGQCLISRQIARRGVDHGLQARDVRGIRVRLRLARRVG